ncbi:MAG TPA: hypothetical protein VJX92_09955 [Methylomirabilota bacterium]|nr:hypothetical protein [Methylomirabilota bacterium]
MRTITSVMVCVFALASGPAIVLAQSLDCQRPIQRAQKSIDKVTDDLKGMESMPKDQLDHVHALLDDAKKSLDAARQGCGKPQDDYARARALGDAEAAHGYATAADRLHFTYMKGAKGMSGMKNMGGMQEGKSDMSGMSSSPKK